MRWTVTLDGGPRRVNHAAVSIGNKIFSFGGYCTGEDYEKARPIDVHVLNTVTLRWTLLPLPSEPEEVKLAPYQRYGHTAVEYDYCAYIWGGRNDWNGYCGILYAFHEATRKWSQPNVTGNIPEARDGHSACVINARMYIFGGYEEYSDEFSNDMNYIDLRSFQWVSVATKGNPPSWRDFHTATAVDNLMYVFGGRCDEGNQIFTNREVYCNKVMAFDTSTKTWIQLDVSNKETPVGRRSHSAFTYRGYIYVFGGYNGKLGTHFNDLYVLDLASLQWSQLELLGPCPTPCRRQCCCIVDSKVYLFGGTSPISGEPASPSPYGTEENLSDRSDLFILDLDPSLKTLASMVIIENKLDCSSLPHDLRWELSVMTSNNKISSSEKSFTLKGVEPL